MGGAACVGNYSEESKSVRIKRMDIECYKNRYELEELISFMYRLIKKVISYCPLEN